MRWLTAIRVRGDPRVRHQQRRRAGERASPRPASADRARSIADALASAGGRPDDDQLHRGTRHRHRARRLDRDAGADQGVRRRRQRGSTARIGSVKANIGHLDAAAGVAGLIKTVLALQHRSCRRRLHFERPNPDIKFESTPFYVNAALQDVAENAGAAAARRRQLVRVRRDQRARRRSRRRRRPPAPGPSRRVSTPPVSADTRKGSSGRHANCRGYLSGTPRSISRTPLTP